MREEVIGTDNVGYEFEKHTREALFQHLRQLCRQLCRHIPATLRAPRPRTELIVTTHYLTC